MFRGSVLAAVMLAAAGGITVAASPPDAVADRETAALGYEGPELIAIPWSEAPGATTVITAEEIERSGASNIFDLLRRVPGVDIRFTPMGGHISIRSNGSSPFSEEVLMLIDGSPYNSPDKGGFPGHPNYTASSRFHGSPGSKSSAARSRSSTARTPSAG